MNFAYLFIVIAIACVLLAGNAEAGRIIDGFVKNVSYWFGELTKFEFLFSERNWWRHQGSHSQWLSCCQKLCHRRFRRINGFIFNWIICKIILKWKLEILKPHWYSIKKITHVLSFYFNFKYVNPLLHHTVLLFHWWL